MLVREVIVRENIYNVLIVDDEKEIIELLRLYLEQEGINLIEAYDGEMAYEMFRKYKVDLALIDIMMPRMNGYELVKKVRNTIPSGNQIDIMFLTARGGLNDKILGFNLGADDYITKPFEPLEIVARVNARLRRKTQLEPSAEQIILGNLTLNLQECTLYVGEKEFPLTKVEYLLIKLFMEHPGRVFTKEQIYEVGWEETYIVDDNTIRVMISRLRDKIGEDKIKTIRGLGYRMEKER